MIGRNFIRNRTIVSPFIYTESYRKYDDHNFSFFSSYSDGRRNDRVNRNTIDPDRCLLENFEQRRRVDNASVSDISIKYF